MIDIMKKMVSGHLKIKSLDMFGFPKLLVDTTNLILVSAYEELPRVISGSGLPVDKCQFGLVGGGFSVSDRALRSGVVEGDGGVEPTYQIDTTLENNTSVLFTFYFNADPGQTLYTYLSGQGDPEIKEAGLVIGSDTGKLFAAVDIEGLGSEFNINAGIVYIAEWQIKFSP